MLFSPSRFSIVGTTTTWHRLQQTADEALATGSHSSPREAQTVFFAPRMPLSLLSAVCVMCKSFALCTPSSPRVNVLVALASSWLRHPLCGHKKQKLRWARTSSVLMHVETLQQGADFVFVTRDMIFSQERGPLPRHQKIEWKWFYHGKLSIHNVFELNFKNCVAVSYVWLTREDPDPKGVQADALRCWLRQRWDIEYVWIDWCCLPQGARNDEEVRKFEAGLFSVNLIYLSCTVLKIVNYQYMSRFWPQFEAWLSFQSVKPGGRFEPDVDASEASPHSLVTLRKIPGRQKGLQRV